MTLETADDLLFGIKSWNDPYPPPVLEVIDNITVVRDDLLGVGSKVRFADYLIKNSAHEEFVFTGANPVGWGPISLAYVCQKYGRKATIFAAARKEPTWHQAEAMKYGAKYIWLKMGMLTVCRARGRAYINENPENRIEVPMGLEHWSVLGSIIKVAGALPVVPKEVWTVGSSGTLSRGLQLAWPNAEFNVVQIGHGMNKRECGRAKLWISKYKYNKATKAPPPFPSADMYDAKAWEFIQEHATKDPSTLFWNVAG